MKKHIFSAATAEILNTIAFGTLFVGIAPFIAGVAAIATGAAFATAFTVTALWTIGIAAAIGTSFIFASTAIKKTLEAEGKEEAAAAQAAAQKTIVITRTPAPVQYVAAPRDQDSAYFQQKLAEPPALEPRAR